MAESKLVGLPGELYVNPDNLLYLESGGDSPTRPGRPCAVLRFRDGAVKNIYGEVGLSSRDFTFSLAQKFGKA